MSSCRGAGGGLRAGGAGHRAARYASGLDSPDYTSIIDQRAFDRLLGRWTRPARAARRWCSCWCRARRFDAATRKIAPHLC
jgi:hypothetical protein